MNSFRPENEDISEKSEDDLVQNNHKSNPTSSPTEDKPSSATSSISKEEDNGSKEEGNGSKDDLVLGVIGDRQDSGLSSHGDSPSGDTDV